MMCNSFIIAGLLDLSAFPVLSLTFFPAVFFSYPSLSSRVFSRDPIYNDLVLFHIIFWRRWSPLSFESIGNDLIGRTVYF